MLLYPRGRLGGACTHSPGPGAGAARSVVYCMGETLISIGFRDSNINVIIKVPLKNEHGHWLTCVVLVPMVSVL